MQETPKSLIWLRFTAEPRTGRFITRDTYRGERENAHTWHLYVYCANNPINHVDPTGNKRVKEYSAAKSFDYKGPYTIGEVYITIVLKWTVSNKKKITDFSSRITRKKRYGFAKLEEFKRRVKKISSTSRYAYVKYFGQIAMSPFAHFRNNEFSLPIYTFCHPPAIVYNDGGVDWYKRNKLEVINEISKTGMLWHSGFRMNKRMNR